jgi:hypothetical protein
MPACRYLFCLDLMDPNPRSRVGLPTGPGCKCADVLGLAPDKRSPHRIVIAESKGTEVSKAINQLGNASAAALERFGSSAQQFELLLYRSELRLLDVGLSPGPGYLVTKGSSAHDFLLVDATTQARPLARAKCDLGAPWSRWNSKLQSMNIHVYVERV